VFVPEEHMAGYLRRDRVPVTPLYAFPNFTFLALGIASVCLGIARSSITELVDLAVSKKRVGARATVSEQQTAQIKLAEAEANLRSARLFFYDTIESAWELAKSGDPVSVEKRRDMRLATTNAVNKSVAIVSDMYDLGGGSAVYKNSRLQRSFRDVNVAKSHIMVAQQTLEIIGALFFGLTPNTSRL
jgi:alkylation response protein AidB-like acyl-CoA dehydrogenase